MGELKTVLKTYIQNNSDINYDSVRYRIILDISVETLESDSTINNCNTKNNLVLSSTDSTTELSSNPKNKIILDIKSSTVYLENKNTECIYKSDLYFSKYINWGGQLDNLWEVLGEPTPEKINISHFPIDVVLDIHSNNLLSNSTISKEFLSIEDRLEVLEKTIPGGGGEGDYLSLNSLIKYGDSTPESDNTVYTSLRSLYEDNKRLRKDIDDRSEGLISSDKGFEVGRFIEGLLGEGAKLYEDSNGKTRLELDYIYVRLKAYFDTIEINKLQANSGNRITSAANMSCIAVEEFDSYYRCFFKSDDGEDIIANDFIVGDQAITKMTNFKRNGEAEFRNKYYWRLVVGIGDDYIDLSKTDYDKSSNDIPEIGDNIIQLGNRSDTDRQNAIEEMSVGAGAPSYRLYKGIDSYSLKDKEMFEVGYNPETGKSYMNSYGDAWIGSKKNGKRYQGLEIDSETGEAILWMNSLTVKRPSTGEDVDIEGEIEDLEEVLDAINSDTVFDITEKHRIRDIWYQIHGIASTELDAGAAGRFKYTLSQPMGDADPIEYSQAVIVLTNAHSALKAELHRLTLYKDENVSPFDRDSLSALFATYYTAEAELYKVISKGNAGDDSVTVQIYSSNGNQFLNSSIETTLYAWVFQGSEEVTNKIAYPNFNWKRKSKDSIADAQWNEIRGKGKKQIDLTIADVYKEATFDCEVNIESLTN